MVDLNVVLDVLFDRAPHATHAALLWSAAEGRRIHAFLPAHAIPTLEYLSSRQRGRVFARGCVRDVLRVFDVAPVDREVLSTAAALGWSDFEDAVTSVAAEKAGCDGIVSRDRRGFRKAALKVLDPAAACVWLGIAAGRARQ